MNLLPRILSTIELDGLEKICSLHAGWIVIGYAAHLKGDPTILLNNFNDVLPHLLKRYPRMRTRLRLNGFQQFLDVFDYDEDFLHPNLFYSIQNSADQTWQKLVEEQCNRNPYSDNGTTAFPLFHFVLIYDQLASDVAEQTFHLLLFSHHSVSDGRTGFILINDLLTLATSVDLHQHVEPVNVDVLPCLINFIPRRFRPFSKLRTMIDRRAFKRELLHLRQPRIPVESMTIPNESNSFGFQPVALRFLFSSSSSTLYKRLHDKCRLENVTLHGPLFVCLLLAIERCFPQSNENRRYLNPWGVDVDFDLRTRLPNSPFTSKSVGFTIGIHSFQLKHRYLLRSTRFWTLARKSVNLTRKTISRGEIFSSQHFFADLLRDERFWTKNVTKSIDGRLGEFNFSNIGKFPFSNVYQGGQLCLEGFHVVNSSSIYRTSNIIFVTCVGETHLDFSLAYEMPSEKAKEFFEFYIQLIENCADSPTNVALSELLDKIK